MEKYEIRKDGVSYFKKSLPDITSWRHIMSKIVGNIEFYSGPNNIGAPDNLEEVIINFIDGAEKRLYIAVQELDNQKIAEAIIRAKKRKILVKIVIEQDYLRSKKIKQDPFDSGGNNEFNRSIHNAMLRSNIDVKCDYNTSIFHQKFITRDSTSILTGSTNFTVTGVESNLNHIIIIHNEKITKIYEKEFREIQQGHFGKYNEGHDKKPPVVQVGDIAVKVLFAPDHNPEMEIMKQMLKAKKRIDFAIFTFSKSSGIDDTMLRLLDLEIPITGAFDASQGGNKWSAIGNLHAKGAKLYAVGKGDGIGKLHHKLMVLDDQIVIAGSFNYTGPANLLNDENIIILGDLDTTSNRERKAQAKIAQYAKNEIDRIINIHGTPLAH